MREGEGESAGRRTWFLLWWATAKRAASSASPRSRSAASTPRTSPLSSPPRWNPETAAAAEARRSAAAKRAARRGAIVSRAAYLTCLPTSRFVGWFASAARGAWLLLRLGARARALALLGRVGKASCRGVDRWWGQVGVEAAATRDPIGAVSASGSGGGVPTRRPVCPLPGYGPSPTAQACMLSLFFSSRQEGRVVADLPWSPAAPPRPGTAMSTSVQPTVRPLLVHPKLLVISKP